MIQLPFEVPDNFLIQISKDKKPKYKGWKCDKYFKPFIHPTAIGTGEYSKSKFLFVLDFDYDDKWDNPIYQSFKYKDTYTRETKHGLHLFYWSPVPCDIIQKKDGLNVDLRRVTSIGYEFGKKGNYIVVYDLPDNDLPVMEIDCNIVIEELYNMVGLPIVHYGDPKQYNSSDMIQYIPDDGLEPTSKHKLVAYYLSKRHDDWSHAYDLSFKWGLVMNSYFDNDVDVECIGRALMDMVEYPKKYLWLVNFMNGFRRGDKGNGEYFKGEKHSIEYLNKLKDNWVDDFFDEIINYPLSEFLNIVWM